MGIRKYSNARRKALRCPSECALMRTRARCRAHETNLWCASDGSEMRNAPASTPYYKRRKLRGNLSVVGR